MKVDRVAPGHYRVTSDAEGAPSASVYVAGPAGHRWAFWNGRVYREEVFAPPARVSTARPGAAQPITAPMPATVLKVLVAPGQAVHKGDTLVIVEAMKMELPLRASADAVVTTVRCREGELVQPDTRLVELE